LTVAEAASMYVRRKKVTGGSRAVKSVVNTIASNLSQSQWTDTNPPAVAGATEVENQLVDTTDLPLITGASDTATDNKTFAWMALLGGGLFPTSAGLDTSRWATALEMDKAQSMLFEEYKQFWAAQIRRIGTIVLLARQKFGGRKYDAVNTTIAVSIDTFSLTDFPIIAETLGKFVQTTIQPMLELGAVDARAATAIVIEFYRMALSALGVERVDELASDEAFGLNEEPEEMPIEPEETQAAVEKVLENLRGDLITPEQAALFVMGELAELAG